MALQGKFSPPMVEDSNEDTTQTEGDAKSDDSSQRTDDVDLEEGEILDSGEETEEKKDLTNSSLQDALDKNFLKNIEKLMTVAQEKDAVPLPTANENAPQHKINTMFEYLDHDKFENNSDEDNWYSPPPKSKLSEKPIDYRKELETYRGTPPSSPERKIPKQKVSRPKKSSKKNKKNKNLKAKQLKFIKESKRRKVCKYFKEGNCVKGADCDYSHASPFKKKELCRYYTNGHCNKGSDCTYMHGEFPCKFYHTSSTCYAKETCRYSHAPLTDETENILAEYLKKRRGDVDYDDRKIRNSPEPETPPPKRACLLGSPPRHIKEAVETLEWQEEMLRHQHGNPAFKIHPRALIKNSFSPVVPKPFYLETMPSSPTERNLPHVMDKNFIPQANPAFLLSRTVGIYSQSVPSDNFVYEEDYQYLDDEMISIKQEVPECSWTNTGNDGHIMPSIKNEDPDFTNDINFNETTQFSEMKFFADNIISSVPSSRNLTISANKGNKSENLNSEVPVSDDKSMDDSSPVVIPSHLPKKQQELFKRIHQHQNKAVSASAILNSPKSCNSSESPDNEIEETKQKIEDVYNTVSSSNSSDEDDCDTDEPLTHVLKKLQEKPPYTRAPVNAETKPVASIMELLNKVQQNASQRNRLASDPQSSHFFKHLLSVDVPSPHGKPAEFPRIPFTDSSFKKEPTASKDRDLKNRDPRILARTNNGLNLQLEQNNSQNVVIQHTKITTFTTTVMTLQENRPQNILIQDKVPTATNSTTVMTNRIKAVPYKLHEIDIEPPNYAYIHACQFDPNLLKDPRLQRHLHLKQNCQNGITIKRHVDSFKNENVVPPIPKLLLSYDKTRSVNINIFEPSPGSKTATEENQDLKPLGTMLTDQKIIKQNSPNCSESDTPAHLEVVDNLTPSLANGNIRKEEGWTPPVLLEISPAPCVLDPVCNISIKQGVSLGTDIPLGSKIENILQNSPRKITVNTEKDCPIPSKKTMEITARHPCDPRMAKYEGLLDSRYLRSANLENENIQFKPNNLSDAPETPPSDVKADKSENKTEKYTNII